MIMIYQRVLPRIKVNEEDSVLASWTCVAYILNGTSLNIAVRKWTLVAPRGTSALSKRDENHSLLGIAFCLLLSAYCLLATAFCLLFLRCRHIRFADVEIGGNLLHVVVVFEGFH
jgi:hypothetical protein